MIKDYTVKIHSALLTRQDKIGKTMQCDGFRVEIFRAKDGTKLDEFTAAVGFELLENSLAEAEQLAMDYLGCEKGKYSQHSD